MNLKKREKWEKTRKKGRKKYILMYGLYGVILLTSTSILSDIIRPLIQGNLNFNASEFFVYLASSMIIGFGCGSLTGWLSWDWYELAYKSSK